MANILESLEEGQTKTFPHSPTLQGRREGGTVIIEAKRQEQAPAMLQASPQAQDLEGKLLKTINDNLLLADQEPSAIKAFTHIANMNAAIAKTKADFTKEAQATAFATYQIPQLEEALRFSEQKDRAHPLWEQYQRDTPETAEIRQRLSSSKSAANASMDESLASNPVYSSMLTKAASLAKAGESILSKKLNKEQAYELEAERFTRGIGVEGHARLATLFPDQAGDPIALMAAVELSPKKREVLGMLDVPQEQLPVLAFRGNNTALNYISAHETKIGRKENAALIAEGFQITQNAGKAAEALNYLSQRGLFNGKQGRIMKEEYEAALIPALQTNQEAREASARKISDIASTYVRLKAADVFNSNIMGKSPVGTAPAWLVEDSLNAAVSPDGRVSIDQAVGLAFKAKTREERQVRSQELIKYYETILNQPANSKSLFPIDPFELNRIKAKIAQQEVTQMMGMVSKHYLD